MTVEIIGVALVGLLSVFKASASASIDSTISEGFNGDFVVTNNASLSVIDAPALMSSAQKKPRRAPSFMMVRLTGPTGIESRRPLIKPVSPEIRMG